MKGPAMIETWSQPATWMSLATLSAMEIVLGIDNVVFLAVLAGKLPPERQPAARRIGLVLALGMRLLLLLAVTWLMGLTRELFRLLGQGFTGRDLILAGGGLFLITKATFEIHDKLEVRHEPRRAPGGAAAFGMVLFQIAVLDVVFSLDSVITAVGMAGHLSVMVAAMVIAVAVMMAFAGAIGTFVERHPTMKMLALAFLLLVGLMLVAEGTGRHIERGYVYFAMAFSLGVELLNMRMRRAMAAPVALHNRFGAEAAPAPSEPPAPAPPPAGPAAGR
jgi:predicted tellurium resistance membrane protein TerC